MERGPHFLLRSGDAEQVQNGKSGKFRRARKMNPSKDARHNGELLAAPSPLTDRRHLKSLLTIKLIRFFDYTFTAYIIAAPITADIRARKMLSPLRLKNPGLSIRYFGMTVL